MEPTTARPTFGDESAVHPSWEEVAALLADAELYWLTTVRADGRPHVTPLVGVWLSDADGGTFCFTTGAGEQKHVNLGHAGRVAVTTGTNTWAAGTDVVVEGRAERLTGIDRTAAYAQAFVDKYGEAWSWQPTDDGFVMGGDDAMRPEVFVVAPTKVLVFAKDPHGQSTFRP